MQSSRDADATAGAYRRATVVVAESDPRLRASIEDVVASDSASFEVVATACDAVEAVEAGLRHQPDIMLVDAGLPRGTGVHAVRELSALAPGTRIVALSDYGDRKHVLQMLDAGAEGYLIKSANLDVLGALRSVRRGHSVLSDEVAGHLIAERAELAGARAGTTLLDREQIRNTIDARSFSMAFQPIFSLSAGVAVGIEALARLSPNLGLSADMWFSEAWTLGLGVDLELAVISSALESARSRPAETFLSVNVSPNIVANPAFRALMTRFSERGRLVLEITEHEAVKDYQSLNDHLSLVRKLGVLVAVDDVGAGYANFRHVLTLRPDMIKLDVTLTAEMDTDRSRRALASGIVAAARELGATVVAEGIETRAQLECLTSLGVEYGQGFLLARPGPLTLVTR